MDEYIYEWPDGTWCYESDLEEYLTFMSDDYQKYLADNYFLDSMLDE